ncbi:MAG: hypothetical protein KGN77_01530 [Xanthomonadaceae bacterium]|nr:hypothetical protein [Xanthomonadaceae bacterium]MDE1963052.1 hypothetical protein [Xanthomonadaceae bacterium]
MRPLGHDPEAFRHVRPIASDTDPLEVRTTLERIGYVGPIWVATGGMPLLQRYAGNTLRAVPYEVRLDAESRTVGAS